MLSAEYSKNGPLHGGVGRWCPLARWYDVDDMDHAANSGADLTVEYPAALTSRDSGHVLVRLVLSR